MGSSFALIGLSSAWLYRAVRLTALIDLIALAGFVGIAQAASVKLGLFDDPLDVWLRLLQLLCLLGVVGAGLSVWNAARVWRESGRSWWAKTSVSVTALALVASSGSCVSLQLVTARLKLLTSAGAGAGARRRDVRSASVSALGGVRPRRRGAAIRN